MGDIRLMPHRAKTKYPVILVHGYYATRATNAPIERFLKGKGFRVFDVNLPGLNWQDMRKSSLVVARRVEEVKRETGADQIVLVGISMGGLIALHYVRKRGGAAHVRRCISLGSPLNGTPLAPLGQLISGFQAEAGRQIAANSDFIQELHAGPHEPCEIVSIGAVGDPMVPERSFSIPGATNVLSPHGVWPAGHYSLVLDRRNMQLLLEHLPE